MKRAKSEVWQRLSCQPKHFLTAKETCAQVHKLLHILKTLLKPYQVKMKR